MNKSWFERWQRHLTVAVLILGFIIGIASLIFKPIYSPLVIFVIIILFLALDKDWAMLNQLWVAFGTSLVWNIFARDLYGYNKEVASIFGLNMFPLFAWTVGLFGFYALFHAYIVQHDKWSNTKKVIVVTVVYLIIIIAAETIGYHVLGLHNLSTSSYPGLPICDCIHAPRFMQAFYLMIGPIYFLICSKMKNPYLNIRKNPFKL
jgi:hypothetical protein